MLPIDECKLLHETEIAEFPTIYRAQSQSSIVNKSQVVFRSVANVEQSDSANRNDCGVIHITKSSACTAVYFLLTPELCNEPRPFRVAESGRQFEKNDTSTYSPSN